MLMHKSVNSKQSICQSSPSVNKYKVHTVFFELINASFFNYFSLIPLLSYLFTCICLNNVNEKESTVLHG